MKIAEINTAVIETNIRLRYFFLEIKKMSVDEKNITVVIINSPLPIVSTTDNDKKSKRNNFIVFINIFFSV